MRAWPLQKNTPANLPACLFSFWSLTSGVVLRNFLTGFLIDNLHGQTDLAALVKAHQLDPDLVTFLDHVGDLGNLSGGQLGNVNQTVLGTEEVDESAEVNRI